MTAQRGNENSSHFDAIYFHGWNTIAMKWSCSVSHAESYHYMQIISILGLNRWKQKALLRTTHYLCSSKIIQELHPIHLHDTRLGQAVIQLHEKKRIELESLVRTVYNISYKKRQFALLRCPCELQQLNGLALGENYSNVRGVKCSWSLLLASYMRKLS